jgi:glycerol-1-phosphatase
VTPDVPLSLLTCETALTAAYDAALLDLDGVLYRGTEPIEYAADAAAAARAAGMRMAFVTNNASRTPEAVAALLRSVGVEASLDEVATSARAAARLLAQQLPAGSRVLVVGGEGLHVAVADCGLVPVTSADDAPVAVVQGYGPELTYAHFAEAALAVARGALWVATNLDSTVPSPRGLVPGNGALVALVRTATGADPIAAGKPARPLHDEAVLRTGAQRPLVVGDRLDTDIEGAVAVGADSLLVLTGVASLPELLAARSRVRPSYVGLDLRALLAPQPAVTFDGRNARCEGVTAHIDERSVVFSGSGTTTAALRAACAAAWQRGEEGAGVTALRGQVPAELATLL